MKSLIALIFACCMAISGWAQTPPDSLNGAALRTWIRDNYYVGKHVTLGYNTARKKMYAYIDNVGGTLTCVYGGATKALAYGTEVTSIAPFNCEHTVPQSFFNSADPMVSDIHHLYPVYDNWNTIRSNYPFYEIPDVSTQLWMRGTVQQSTMPTTNIGEYAEYYSGAFEPREAHKGNLARSVAYFFTMYPTEAGNLSSVISPTVLCNWSALDTVDAVEILRDQKTFQYQGNHNPYVLHPDWLVRAWCPQLLPTQNSTALRGITLQNISPNPATTTATLALQSNENIVLQVSLIDLTGRVLLQQNEALQTGNNRVTLDVTGQQAGYYWVRLTANAGVATLPLVIYHDGQ